MSQYHPPSLGLDVSPMRRTFLRSSLLLAVPAVLGGTVFSAAAAVFNPPARSRGTARVDVRTKGAKGNGTTDDTTAFQNAINSLPSTGGTIYVPAGTYLIDANRSVKLRSRNHLQLSPDAKLVAKPTSVDKHNVVLIDSVSDVEVSGGRIVGERAKHQASVGEHGHGIRVRGATRVTIRDIHISNCWGDGICAGPKPVYRAPYVMSRDVVVANVVCTNNRRNALSIGNVVGMRVFDSEFSYTNGTSPQCGLDVEPDGDVDDKGYCDNIHIENCTFLGNAMYGINLWRRARGVTIKGCILRQNKSCGLASVGATRVILTGNTVNANMLNGVFIKQDNNTVRVEDNTFYNNYMKQGVTNRAYFSMVGAPKSVQKDLIKGAGSVNVTIGRNHYR